MKTFLYLLIFSVVASCGNLKAQQHVDYSIVTNEEGHQLISGSSSVIQIPENSCFEAIEESDIHVGKNYVIIQVLDEMYNNRGVIIFDKDGNQIDYSAVQQERKKHYSYFDCCVNVQEYKGKLYFWDIANPGNPDEDYDCYYDSQTDTSWFIIPRYYVFDPKSGSLEAKIPQSRCSNLIVDGKLVCH